MSEAQEKPLKTARECMANAASLLLLQDEDIEAMIQERRARRRASAGRSPETTAQASSAQPETSDSQA